MINASLGQICQWVGGDFGRAQDVRIESIQIKGVGTDTRQSMVGQLFIALTGARFDGHKFLADAREQGARAALVSSYQPNVDLPQIVVADTLTALGALAHHWRIQVDPKVVLITGSAGKTTVKQLVAAMLAQTAATVATRGNRNNEIGLPLTLLDMPEDTRFAVLEAGANHVGEIAKLTQIAQPDLGLVTMAGRAHLGEFGGVEAVIRAKGELYQHLDDQAIALINLASPGAEQWQQSVTAEQQRGVCLLEDDNPAICAQAFWRGERQQGQALQVFEGDKLLFSAIQNPMAGRHNAINLLLAIACARGLGVGVTAIEQGVQNASLPSGRMQQHWYAGQVCLIDDSYNANPESMQAALAELAEFQGPRVAVLGSMGELGEYAEQLHIKLGEQAAQAGVTQLIAVGPHREAIAQGYRALQTGQSVFLAEDASGAKRLLASSLAYLDQTRAITTPLVVLLKGSRFMQLETLIPTVQAHVNHQQAGDS